MPMTLAKIAPKTSASIKAARMNGTSTAASARGYVKPCACWYPRAVTWMQ
ncbi:Uncharacterised protein [uncultured archaeon]|nr:Uncharacterised protein [uncultured archaeon]